MGQLQLFSRAELASMRDRTRARNYSASRDEFRRDHERRRAWGLQRRHAERLRHVREQQAGCWPEDLQIAPTSVEARRPGPPGPSPVPAAAPPRAVRRPAPSRDPQPSRETQAGPAEEVEEAGPVEQTEEAVQVGPVEEAVQAGPVEQTEGVVQVGQVEQTEEVVQPRPVEQAGPVVESRCGSDSSPSPEPGPPRSSHGCHPTPTPGLPASSYPAVPTRLPRSWPESPTPHPLARPPAPDRAGEHQTRPDPTDNDPIGSKAPPPNIPRPEHHAERRSWRFLPTYLILADISHDIASRSHPE
jgi:hypothetical protein